ncbi:MAG: PLP-dependent aminotransferase family protein, partial [Clostridiales bacterium]|nr:PLP-dependent aminotransferase family protein [Clostridiales bacterium]
KDNVYAIENPGYRKIDMVLKNSSSAVRYVPLDKDGMIIDSLRQTDANIAYITPSHQFPTGAIMPVWRRLELLSWANEAKRRYIIEDDYNSEFHFSGKPIPSVQGFDTNGRVIYLGTFSRILAPSIRIAYMVLPEELLKEYENRFAGYSSSVPRFEQQTLSEFISGGYLGRHINRVKNIYRKRRDALLKELTERPERMRISGQRAGLHLLVTPESFAKNELIKKAERNKVRIYQLSQYCFTEQPHLDNTIILGYAGIKTEQTAEAVRLLFEDK